MPMSLPEVRDGDPMMLEVSDGDPMMGVASNDEPGPALVYADFTME